MKETETQLLFSLAKQIRALDSDYETSLHILSQVSYKVKVDRVANQGLGSRLADVISNTSKVCTSE